MNNTHQTEHRLAPMFEAQTIAIAGASPRDNSFGMRLIKAQSGFQGQIDFINPRHNQILDKKCISQITDLDYSPDLLILGVGSSRVEAALQDAVKIKAKSCVIYDDCHDDQVENDNLLERLRIIATEAKIPVCGGNCMGFLNITDQRFGSYYPADHLKAGGITLIAHSGSVFTVLAMSDYRYRFDLVISPGQEIGTTIDEYIEYALTRSTTKVIALFMETARNPKKFLVALKNAREKGIPVIVCKVGATNESAKMAQSHTGAIAGSFTAYIAAMESCGAIVVDTVDQLMNTALLCSQGRIPPAGGLATITDSGGLREVTIDRAAALNSPLAKITPQLAESLKKILPPSLLPSNPLDCLAELNENYDQVFESALKIFDQSNEVAMLGLECDFRDDFNYAQELLELAHRLPDITQKPCFLYSSFSQANNKVLAQTFADINLPFLNGLDEVLNTVSLFLKWRDNKNFLAEPDSVIELDQQKIDHWKNVLNEHAIIDEALGLKLLNDFGIETTEFHICENEDQLVKSMDRIQFPIALKTAEKNINHKSDLQAVFLNLQNQDEVISKYNDLKSRIGERVIIQRMAPKGIEISFGAIHDSDFNVIVMVSAGGILVETLQDRQFALAPFGVKTAECIINRLKISKLLDGYRGQDPVNKTALAHSLALFSSIAFQLEGSYTEIDVNPIIINQKSAIAVDALIIKE